jgi:hypothetical protein
MGCTAASSPTFELCWTSGLSVFAKSINSHTNERLFLLPNERRLFGNEARAVLCMSGPHLEELQTLWPWSCPPMERGHAPVPVCLQNVAHLAAQALLAYQHEALMCGPQTPSAAHPDSSIAACNQQQIQGIAKNTE